MEASFTPIPTHSPNTDTIKRRLLQKGVYPTPKVVHTLRKKEIQKSIRKSKKIAQNNPPISESEKQLMEEEYQFQTIKQEYRELKKEFKPNPREKNVIFMVGKPWEKVERSGFRETASGSKEYSGGRLKVEPLKELSEILAERLLDDDVVVEEEWLESGGGKQLWKKREVSDEDAVHILVKRLSATNFSMQDWKFARLMKQSGLSFTERHLLNIVGGLGSLGSWSRALSVVEWVYNRTENKHYKSRFVYTKLLAVLGKARMSTEALRIFNQMRDDCRIYPDMPAYRSISVTLGQAGLVKELMNVIECMRQKPSQKVKNMRRKNWDPRLEPDVVVFNAVLNACIPSHQWKGVSWVLEQMRKNGLKPNGATYGLAMEVMLQSGKYDLVHEFFGKMKRSGTAPNALTYKVLVRTLWEEGKVNEAVKAVRDMEQRGVVGTASVYYELACCLCKNGRWREAMLEVEKLKRLPLTKPLEVAFTGMIMSSMDGGHIDDCILIFEKLKDHCSPNIGTINAMLKVFGRNDMFAKAEELFEKVKRKDIGCSDNVSGGCFSLVPDAYTYSLMLEASAAAHQWEYFEYVYKDMVLSRYQIDQTKHAWLLVEASKSGKWHLLEHAFDTTLEAGEIPHLEFFTEMVSQATAQHDYERVVSLVNSMAHASFQVSESQWRDIFMGSRDQIHEDGLHMLLDTLQNSEIVREPIVFNLLKSLKSICRSSSPTESLDLIVSGGTARVKATSGERLSIYEGKKGVKMQNCSVDTMDRKPNPDGTFPNSSSISVSQAVNTMDDVGISAMSLSLCFIGDKGRQASFFEESECLTADTRSNVPAGSLEYRSSSTSLSENSEEDVEVTLDLLTCQFASSRSELPLASEILEDWRKSRNKEGIFFPFANVKANEHKSSPSC